MRDKLFKIGCLLGFTAGILAIIRGLTFYVFSFFPDMLGTLPSAWIFGGEKLVVYLSPSLLITRGLTIILLVQFGMKTKQSWCWFLFLVLSIYSPLSTLAVQLEENLFPSSYAQLLLMIPAVALMGPYVFSGKEKN